MNRQSSTKKRKVYTTFSDKTRAEIGRYAAENSNASAIRKFRSDFPDLGESTVRLFKRRYVEEVRKARGGRVEKIVSRKRGRPLTLGKELDDDAQKFVKALRKAGTPINTAVILAAVEGIITAKDRTLLACNGGHIKLNKSWAKSLMARMNLVKRRGSTKSRLQLSGEEYERVQRSYLTEIVQKAQDNKVPPQLIINWDQTGLNVQSVIALC